MSSAFRYPPSSVFCFDLVRMQMGYISPLCTVEAL
uniref:Uncharacterized protein n=1 Tax=Anguilla anguilla TaxID=7936 RepID=A0A0E9Q2A2_ANGAN